MGDETRGQTHSSSQEGTVASHPLTRLHPFKVAPTTDGEANTYSLDIIPVACMALSDILFEFDSSFVTAEVTKVIKDLPWLRAHHTNNKGENAPLAIFGHADPVGDDPYNKKLSGRRATAIYGLLTHNTSIWEQLYNNPHGGDNWQSKGVVSSMKKALGPSAPSARKALIQAYMELLCPFQLKKEDFLGRGADAAGKADYMGCGEFNPMIVLSTDESKKLTKEERDKENQPNRRVVIYLFRPGDKVDAKTWPCPTAVGSEKECHKRFFVTPVKGDDRRKAGSVRRKHEELKNTEKDTFACRLYHRIARRSPCEGGGPLSPPCIYLCLRFEDPEGELREFPEQLPVLVRFSPPAGALRDKPVNVGPNGSLVFPAYDQPSDYWRSFTLFFDQPSSPLIICESPPTVVSPPLPRSSRYGTLNISPPAGWERFFGLPRQWQMRQGDWRVGPQGFDGNGEWLSPTATIRHTMPTADIGSSLSPVGLVLDPHWKYLRFEYFDRYFGKNHLRRIAIPPVALEGFRNSPDASGSPPDTHSNWTTGADAKDALQCLPWILRRDPAGNELSPPMQGARVGLRFQTSSEPSSIPVVYSQDENTRTIRLQSPPSSPPSSPPRPMDAGPDRLRYYDLPRVWKSKNYFARGVPDSPPAPSPPPGQFFQDLNPADLARSDNRGTPLVFCLDDIVLTDDRLRQLQLGPGDRVAVMHHAFANRRLSPPDPAPTIANVSNEGVYLPGTDVSPAAYPYSRVHMRNRYYITDYPDWTRLVVAQGNLFDVFAERTPDTPANRAVGARAAVRWVDATTAPNGTAPVMTGSAGVLSPPLPGITQRPFFAIQPYYVQTSITGYDRGNPQPGPVKHNEWTAAYATDRDPGGRVDLALIRCCDVEEAEEVGVLLRYHRLGIDFATASDGRANPLAASPPAMRMRWVGEFIDNATARWNGYDGQNDARTWILRQSSPPQPSPPLRTHVLSLFQYNTTPRAHFNIRSGDPRIVSAMGSGDGDGQLRVNATVHDGGPPPNFDPWGRPRTGRGLAAAHELGHCGSLPDEYENNDDDHPMYQCLNLLGNPYNLEDRSLMRFNWWIRARYLWHTAEWMRRLRGLGNVSLTLSHNDTQAPGASPETDYHLPHYPHSAAHPGRNFVCWPVSFNIRDRSAGGTSLFDSYLYLLGNDKYSSHVLPNLAGGGSRIDGLLVVMLRMQFDFTAVPGNAAFKTSLRDQLYRRITNLVAPGLNFRRFANFQVVAGSRSDPSFDRCLLHFIPSFTTVGVPGAGGSTNASLDAASPHHLRVSLAGHAVAAPVEQSWTNPAPPAAKAVALRVPNNINTSPGTLNARLNTMANLVHRRCFETLGLSHLAAPAANSFQTPGSYLNIVRTVMDVGAPNPVIT